MAITKEQIADALERLEILTAQIGNARVRKIHKDPLKQFIKAVEKELTKWKHIIKWAEDYLEARR